jgi:hypothetical protein
MYIRRTTIKSRRTGEPYYTYRLVESVRLEGGVRQRTLLNLGRHFDVPREQWGLLAQRIEQLLSQQNTLLAIELDPQLEAAAQRYAAWVVRAKARFDDGQAPEEADFQAVDVNRIEFVRPRESRALSRSVWRQCDNWDSAPNSSSSASMDPNAPRRSGHSSRAWPRRGANAQPTGG